MNRRKSTKKKANLLCSLGESGEGGRDFGGRKKRQKGDGIMTGGLALMTLKNKNF